MDLILYHKPGCHLCETLEERVRAALQSQRRTGVSVTLRNIEDRPEWTELYAMRIPVLTLGARVLVEGNPSIDQVRRALASV